MRKITSGIPVHNAEETITSTLISVYAQTGKDTLFISDNASTDTTQQVIKENLQKGDVLICRDQNIGAAQNFVKTLHESPRSAFFHWLAADDLLSKSWIVDNIESVEGTQYKVSFGHVKHIDENYEIICLPSTEFVPKYLNCDCALVRKLYFFLLPEQYGQANSIYGLFNRVYLESAIARFGFREESYCDYLLMSKIIEETPIIFNNTVLTKRISENSWAEQQKKGGKRGSLLNYLIYIYKFIIRSKKVYFIPLLVVLPLKICIYILSRAFIK